MRTTLRLLSIAAPFFVVGALAGEPQLAVHEWGTFTSLQDERGTAIGGINTDDEPVPSFVHQLKGTSLVGPIQLPPRWSKGVTACHRDVTLRLETPVIYFHPPAGSKEPFAIDVGVAFRGGWLTEFYPDANVAAPGRNEKHPELGRLTGETVGTLEWRELRVGTDGVGPRTDERVWLSPRAVDAAMVTTAGRESEKFLFYRGVGHLDAPLSVSRDERTDRLLIRGRRDRSQVPTQSLAAAQARPPFRIGALWLLDVRAGGRAAFRAVGPVEETADAGAVLAETRASFRDAEYSPENLGKLRDVMRSALEADGLFADEAAALLNTWEISYFQSPGLRLFFLVPRQWTDAVLPLRLSSPAELVRVMVGRIEIVTPAQRQLLAEIAKEPAGSDRRWWPKLGGRVANLKLWRDIESGNVVAAALHDQGIEVPEDYWKYIALGRFRNALVLEEAVRRPEGGIRRFIEAYGLAPNEAKRDERTVAREQR